MTTVSARRQKGALSYKWQFPSIKTQCNPIGGGVRPKTRRRLIHMPKRYELKVLGRRNAPAIGPVLPWTSKWKNPERPPAFYIWGATTLPVKEETSTGYDGLTTMITAIILARVALPTGKQTPIPGGVIIAVIVVPLILVAKSLRRENEWTCRFRIQTTRRTMSVTTDGFVLSNRHRVLLKERLAGGYWVGFSLPQYPPVRDPILRERYRSIKLDARSPASQRLISSRLVREKIC